MEKQRDYSIDILKCIAALIITWSHFEKPLGDYAVLATGGAFGDALFFFCSGYTLFLGRKVNGFFNWYKNRINRIYPTVFAWALLRSLLFESKSDNMLHIVMYGGGFFVSCIMIFYVVFYFIKVFAANRLFLMLAISIIITCSSFFVFDVSDQSVSYRCMFSLYFCVMLLGGILGKRQKEKYKDIDASVSRDLTLWGGQVVFLIISVLGYYCCLYIEQMLAEKSLRFLSIFPQLLFVYSLHRLCLMSIMEKIYHNKYAHTFIMLVGGLCLEIYLVQPALLTDKLNWLFPLNLILMFAIILSAAFVLRCLSRIWMQTFKNEDYYWKAVVRI